MCWCVEEEKKRKAEEAEEERRKFARTAGVPATFFDSAKTKAFLNLNKAPQKSILKNRRAAPAAATPPPAANSKATGKEWTSSAPVINKHSFKTPSGGVIKHLEEENEIPKDFFDSRKEAEPEEDQTLPEGFFDDPVQDAKARGIEYKVEP